MLYIFLEFMLWTSAKFNNKYTFYNTKSMTYYVMHGRVNHSQLLSASPLQAWFICGEDGNVITAH